MRVFIIEPLFILGRGVDRGGGGGQAAFAPNGNMGANIVLPPPNNLDNSKN